MPTGGGKSICFQVPALAQEGICLVISPLIALMKDQVYNLKKRNIPAAAIFSGMHRKEIDRTLDNCIYGNTKFLYLSPERLETELFQERLKKMKVSFIAVDEAHCISQWGYDFRPSYLKIAELRNQLPNTPFLALTATATDRVKQDIQDKLGFKKPNVFQKSFTRANLSYSVFYEENKLNKLVHVLRRVRGTGIVYVRSRRKTQEVAQFLRKQRFAADFYHAGLSPQFRASKQDQWIQNKIQIMVCTNAFGMGIDKADVRIVVHLDLPESLEAYYQEAGRGGRDGKRAYAVLLYEQSDVLNLEKNLADSFPETAVIKKVYQSLCNYFQIAIESGAGRSFDFDLIPFSRNYQLSPKQVFNSLKILQNNGFLTLNEALFMPSKVLFIIDKTELYRIQVANRRLEPYIKTILRIYGGKAFDDYVEVNERMLARHLKTSEVYVKNALTYMQQQKIADYIGQKEKPQITFVRPRVALSQLKLDRQLLDFLKKVRTDNINAIKRYVTTKTDCRSQQLVTYFGELDSKRCGVCDVCIQRKKLAVADQLFESIQQRVRLELEKQEGELLPMSELLLDMTQKYKREETLKVIRWMREQKILVINEAQEVGLRVES